MKASTQAIGKWTCPSGNRIDAVFTPNTHKGGDVAFYWDEGPPMPPDDLAYYIQVIRPQIAMKVLALVPRCKQSIFHTKGE